MAFSNAWDEAAPPGVSAANTLDTIIQNFKKDVRERLQDAFPTWTDDDVDPKRVVFHSGNAADRPLPSLSFQGEGYLAIDTGVVSFFNGDEWVDFAANAVGANLNLNSGAGNQASSEVVVTQTVYVTISGTTDGSGQLVIDVSELDITDFEIGYVIHRGYIAKSPQALVRLVEVSTTASTITVTAFDHANSALTTTAVTFLAIFVLRVGT